MPGILRWPGVLPPRDVEVDLLPRPVIGPPSITGGQQTVQSDAGCWQIVYQDIVVVEAMRVKTYRSLAALLNGPATPILVPVFDCPRIPWPDGVPGAAIAHSDDSLFSDGTGYSQPTVDIVAAAAAVRATLLNITVNASAELEGGEYFSVDDHLYIITTVEPLADGPPATYQIGIMPPLRQPIGDDTSLNFDSPVCRCVLADANGMPLMLQFRKIATPTLTFIEDFS